MSDEITTETEAAEQTEVAPEAATETTDLPAEDLRKELEKVRREAASWRVKYRDAEPLVQKAKELEEANKSEAQKAAEARAAAEQRATASESRLARLEACLNAGLDRKFADRLKGSTPEELEADAKELSELFASRESDTPAPSPGRKPQARLNSARVTPGTPDETLDPKKIAAAVTKGLY